MKLVFNKSDLLAITVLSLLSNFGSCQQKLKLRVMIRGNGAKEAATDMGGKIVMEIPKRDITAIELDNETMLNTLTALAEENGFEIEMDQIRQIIPTTQAPNTKSKSAEEIPWGIGRTYEKDGGIDIPDEAYFPNNVIHPICIIDSGYSLSHPDLPNDAEGFPSDWTTDLCGHGTHVAGTIAAIRGNGQGVVGVYPGAPDIIIGKVFSQISCGWSWASSLIGAAQDCIDSGAKIITMSLGGSVFSTIEMDEFQSMYDDDGILHIAAAGNDGNGVYIYPASYDSIMSVGATDIINNIWGSSQHNAQVEIAAPGVGILSTDGDGIGYSFKSGTSMATPHVAGAALVLWNKHSAATNVQIRDALNAGAIDYGFPGYDIYYGNGLLNYWNAVDVLNQIIDPSVSPAPTTTPQPSLAPTACDGNTFTWQLRTDNYGSETSWSLSNDNTGILVLSGDGYASNMDYGGEECINNGCYTFIMADTYGDGMCCQQGEGNYSFAVNGVNEIESGGDFGSSETTEFCCLTETPTTLPPFTPQPTATPTTEPPTTPQPTATPTACDGNAFTWQLLTDNYGSETSWTLSTTNTDNLVLSGDGYASSTEYGGEECINNGCYTFIMSDTYGDGMCCQQGEGNYSFAVNGVNEIESGGDFGSSETTQFCATCVDSDTLLSYLGETYSCATVVASGYCKFDVAATHCPLSCSKCEESACLDSKASWTVDKPSWPIYGIIYDCDDVAVLTSESEPHTIEDACAIVASTCRGTCSYCN